MTDHLIRPGRGSVTSAGRRPRAYHLAALLLALAVGASACSGGDDADGGDGSGAEGSVAATDVTAQVSTDETEGATTIAPVDPDDNYTGVTPDAVVTAAPLKSTSLEKPSDKLQAGARTVADAVGSAGNLTEVWALSQGSDPQATVSRYQVDAASATSPRFRDQFAVQMLTAAQAVAAPRFVDVDGTTVALSEGPTSAAAWFADGMAVLLVANGDDAATRIESLVRTAVPLVADA